MSHVISAAGLALVQHYEGFCADPGQLPDGNWVVGYGHVREGDKGEAVNQDEAAALLAVDLAPFEALVNAKVGPPLSQSQFDALVSFAFSIGAPAFVASQVLRRVNESEFVAAACAMDAWRKSDISGELETVDVLVRRRAAEKAMFLSDVRVDAAPSAFIRAKVDHAASILGAPVKYAPAPAVGSIPVVAPKPEAAARLAEILSSEPETEVLLLTQVVEAPVDDDDDEITTAHAKPVARKIEPSMPTLPVDRRIRSQKNQVDKPFKLPKLNLPKFKLPSLKPSHSFEVLGLGALATFGVGLVAVGGSILFEGHTDGVAIAGASALTAPGLAALFIAGVGLLRPVHHA
jgi:GH24 family phage-related lysozyme (muramidase)